MPETVPAMTPLTPLGGQTPRVVTHGPVTLSENTDIAIASYSARLGQEDAAKRNLAGFIGADVPLPGQAHGGEIGAFWSAVDQWVVLAPHHSHEDLAAQLVACAGGSATVTEQNDAWCRFDLTGDGLADVFERLCPVNVRRCQGGEATRTSIDHLGCFLIVVAPDTITVLGPRSSAGSLHHALFTAMISAH